MKNALTNAFLSASQHTLTRPALCEGVGLHGGERVRLTLHPAEAGSGIRFVRADLPGMPVIPAQACFVTETRLGTTLATPDGVSIATVEHLMAALWGAGVDNAEVRVEGAEVPIMDGSSAPFITLIEQAGLKKQSAPRRFMEILRPVEVAIGESVLRLTPYEGFLVQIAVEYHHPSINRQAASYDFSRSSFAGTLAEARTFGFAHEVEAMRRMGLARGGSLENAIVLSQDGVLNPEGLRFDDEFVRHKALDLVGDLFLAGFRLRAKVEAFKPGHQINTAMAQSLLADPLPWQMVEAVPAAPKSNAKAASVPPFAAYPGPQPAYL